MAATVKNILNNENGMALVIVILMLVIITILGIGATQTSTTEVQLASNERRLVDEFYKAEGGLLDTLERSNIWLTDTFLLAGETAASYTNPNVNFDGGAIDAIAEIRYISKCGNACCRPESGCQRSSHKFAHCSPPGRIGAQHGEISSSPLWRYSDFGNRKCPGASRGVEGV